MTPRCEKCNVAKDAHRMVGPWCADCFPTLPRPVRRRFARMVAKARRSASNGRR
jgi:hypothetical protein